LFQSSVLFSGSGGNCTIIRTEKSKILVDVGISGKRLFQTLDLLKISSEKIDAILVSHEHTDHILGVGIVSRKLSIPVYITKKTYNECKDKLQKLSQKVRFFQTGKVFEIGNILIEPFASSHDAVDPSNFVFFKAGGNKNRKLALVTDTGYASRLLLQKLRDATTIILESNHDKQLLFESKKYSWELKQRISSRRGHLSNCDATGIIAKSISPKLKNIVLVHLSKENNSRYLAKKSMNSLFDQFESKVKLFVSKENEPTKLLDI